MRVWRLCRGEYAETAYDGEGARRVGGRWNSRGMAVVYTSEHLSLAVLETLVHVDIAQSPPHMMSIPAEIPDALSVDALTTGDLPDDWRSSPGHPTLKSLGDDWLEAAQTPVIRVPSAVVPVEHNLLINPNHDRFDDIEIGEPRPFSFDPRLD